MSDFRDLIFYQKAFNNAMKIYRLTKESPAEEKYALSSQIRNSSRSVCTCFAEGYGKRNYIKHFIAKTSDADMENSETIVWLDFALACSYITKEKHHELVKRLEEVGRMLNDVFKCPQKYC